MTIIAFKIVKATSTDELEKKVTALLSDGWQPHGSLAVVASPGSNTFIQPVARISAPRRSETV